MLTALIDEGMYARLKVLRSKLKRANVARREIANVFVPVGAKISSTPPGAARLLFVGRATRDFEEPRLNTFNGAEARAIEILNELPLGRSAFWQLARAITREVLQRTGSNGSDAVLASDCGWSNLAKIGDTKDNSTLESLAIQAPLCIESLRMEIERFRPTGIVITATNYAEHEVIEPVFGKDWRWDTPGRERVAYKLDANTGAAVAFVNHPQGMSPPGTRALVQTFTADLIVRAMEGKPLPPCAT